RATHFLASPAEVTALPHGIYEETAVCLPYVDTAISLLHGGAPLLRGRVVGMGQGVVGARRTDVCAARPLAARALVAVLERRRQEAARMGAGRVHGCTADDIAALRQQLQADRGAYIQGADLVFEITGSPQALNTAIALSGFSSRIVVGSWYGIKSAPVALGGEAHRNRLHFVTSQVSSIAPALSGRWNKVRRHDSAWTMIREINPQRLITHRVPLDEAASLYAMLGQDSSGVLQAVFIYD